MLATSMRTPVRCSSPATAARLTFASSLQHANTQPSWLRLLPYSMSASYTSRIPIWIKIVNYTMCTWALALGQAELWLSHWCVPPLRIVCYAVEVTDLKSLAKRRQMMAFLLLLSKRSMWKMFQNAMLSVLIKFPFTPLTTSTSLPRRFRSEMIMRKHLAHKPINGNQSVREIAHQTCSTSMYSCSLYVQI